MYNNDYTTMDIKEIQNILRTMGLSPSEEIVYIALLEGLTSVKEILKKTGEKRPTIYYALNSLEKRGLVSKTGKEYGNKFQIEPLESLNEIVSKNIRNQEKILKKIEELKNFYPQNKEGSKVLISHFDTSESIKSAIFCTLYSKDKTIRSIVPGNNLFAEIGLDFITEYVEEKKKRKIKTKALWEDIPKKQILETYYSNSSIKQIPLDMHNNFETTVFIYDDKTLYIGPKKENYALLIQSKEHANLMTTIFEQIWSNSKKIQ